ncbi:MAG TPA: Sec-independent protein translocase protein TatB [Gammaproteobacteria bacterium]|jgi:sec-independent protein translocase protein TatB
MEILVVLLLALVVFGPEQLPGVARRLGGWTARARNMFKDLSRQVERELAAEELRKAVAMARETVVPEPSQRS